MKVAAKAMTLLVVLLFLSLSSASAGSIPTITYTLTGPTTASFTILMDSAPNWFESGLAFTVTPIDLIVDGTRVTDTIVFFNSSDLGGLNSVFSNLPDLIGRQLYSGSESDPRFLIGDLHFVDLETGASYTLDATTAPTVPEPSSLLLFGTSLLGLVPFRRKLFGKWFESYV